MIILNITLILLIIYIYYKFKDTKEDYSNINVTVNVNPQTEEDELTQEQIVQNNVQDLYSFDEINKFYKKKLEDQKDMMNLITNPEVDKEIRSGCDLICKPGYKTLSPDFWS